MLNDDGDDVRTFLDERKALYSRSMEPTRFTDFFHTRYLDSSISLYTSLHEESIVHVIRLIATLCAVCKHFQPTICSTKAIIKNLPIIRNVLC